MSAVKADLRYEARTITIDCPEGGRVELEAGTDVSHCDALTTAQLMELVRTKAVTTLYLVQATAKPDGDQDGELAGGPATKPVLDALMSEFAEVRTEPPPGVNLNLGVEHPIPLKEGHKPPSRPAYRLSAREQTGLEKKLADYFKRGWIRPSSSPYGSPVLFTPKPDRSPRMVHNYRAITSRPGSQPGPCRA